MKRSAALSVAFAMLLTATMSGEARAFLAYPAIKQCEALLKQRQANGTGQDSAKPAGRGKGRSWFLIKGEYLLRNTGQPMSPEFMEAVREGFLEPFCKVLLWPRY